MSLHRCHANMTVHVTLEPPVGERVMHLREGDVVDLDEIVRPARPGREALTLREALDWRVAHFEEMPGEMVTADGGPAPAGFTHALVDPTVDLSHATITTIAHDSVKE